MLSYALAIAVAISSLVLFLTAFLKSDLHRRDDFLWSVVGLFYALVLWYCARNITGAVLLGQAAATALLISYSWQILKLREMIANPEKAATTSSFSISQSINGLFKRNRPQAEPVVSSTPISTTPKMTEQEIAIPQTTSPETGSQISTETPEKVAEKITLPVTNAEKTENKPAEIKREVAEKTTSTSKDNLDNQTPKDTEDQAQSPLPSKLPKSSITEDKQPPQAVIDDRKFSQSPTIIEDSEANSDLPSDLPIEPEVVPVSPAITSDNQSKQAEDSTKDTTVIKPKSALDSLETVEVAEVLEALPEEASANRESDQNNVIEVTTTEINVTTETRLIVENQEDKPNSEEV